MYVSVCTIPLLSFLISQMLKVEKPKPVVTNPPVPKPQTRNPTKDPQLQQAKLEEQNQATSLSQMQVPVSSSSGPQPDYTARRSSLMVLENRLPGSIAMRRYDSHSLLSENSIASSRLDLLDSVPYPK